MRATILLGYKTNENDMRVLPLGELGEFEGESFTIPVADVLHVLAEGIDLKLEGVPEISIYLNSESDAIKEEFDEQLGYVYE